MAKAPAKKATVKKSPFKTRKTRSEVSKESDTLTPPSAIAQAIDSFRDCQEQARHFEGEATIHKNQVLDFSEAEYAKRLIGGMGKSFKVLGEESMVTYVVMDASAGLADEDVESFRQRWGDQAADELIQRDFNSIRFDGDVLEANYDKVVEALETLPEEIVETLFKPMLMKARPGAAETAKKYAKNAKELRELLKMLKIRNYIK